MTDLSLRRATLDDISFVTRAIIEAERSGTPRSMYERVFALDEAGLAELVTAMLREDLPGSELSCEAFLLALEGETKVGAIATWIEGESGQPSNMVRASLLGYAIGPDRWAAARPELERLAAVDIPRSPGALQIEAVYVAPGHRGRRITARLIEHALLQQREAGGVEIAQILSVLGNERSRRAFTHAGFTVARETRSESPELLAIFPGSGRLLWERAIPQAGGAED